jgi:superfamily II DNA or RNA helicase
MSDSYADFIRNKFRTHEPCGIPEPGPMPDAFFPHQRDLTRVALQRGRCALFTATGTGKTAMQLAWCDQVSRHTNKPVLMLAPLAVAGQTVKEGERFGIEAKRVNDGSEVNGAGIYVTNYDRLHRFDASVFGGIDLDEGSRLKNHSGVGTESIITAFAGTPFRLSATATPAPNDYVEFGTQCEFLGIRRREEMLAEFFTHDGGDTRTWDLKGHGREAFWTWLASWALVLRKPSDLGYSDEGYDLPPLNIHHRTVALGQEHAFASGSLFVQAAKTLQEQRAIRRASIKDRVKVAADLVASEPNESWVVWGDLNDETDLAEKMIPNSAQVAGKDSTEKKEETLTAFAEGQLKVMISKASVCSSGLNWQHCARMIFLGSSWSYEQVFQATRRVHRYGQRRPVDIYFISTDADSHIIEAMKRKEESAASFMDEGARRVAELTRQAVQQTKNERDCYVARKVARVPSWMAA